MGVKMPDHKHPRKEVSRVKLNVRVSRKRPESLTKQITDQLAQKIDSGEMAAGSPLPSERDLAKQCKVARNVVRGAYEHLMAAGKVQSLGRKGRTVAPRKKAGVKKAAGKK
jgi:GntR family transcriptional regulator / MocR family aminotransferase